MTCVVVHWPVAFPHTGQLITISEENPNEVALDLEPSLVDTWKAMIALRETGKARNPKLFNILVTHHGPCSGQSHWRIQLQY